VKTLSSNELSDGDWLDGFLTRLTSATGVPGISVSIHVAGESTTVCSGLTNAHGVAAMGTQSRFQIGCIAKLLASLATLQLVSEGVLALDTPLHHWLPDIAEPFLGRGISIADLLSHTSGYVPHQSLIVRYEQPLLWDEFAASLGQSQQAFTPGTVFNYNGFDHILLAEVLRRATRLPLAELLRQTVLDRAQLGYGSISEDRRVAGVYVAHHAWNSRSRRYHPRERHDAAEPWPWSLTDITMSTRELTDFCAAVMNCQRVSESHLDLWNVGALGMLLGPVTAVPHDTRTFGWYRQPLVSYGTGCARYGDGFMGHPGLSSGQCCSLVFDPQREVAVAIGINAPVAPLRDKVMATLCEVLDGGDIPVSRAQPVDSATFRSDEVVGRYVGGSGFAQIEVERTGDELVLRIGMPASGVRAERRLALDADGHLLAEAASGGLDRYPICFFRERQSSIPCLMFGWQAHKRVGS